MQASGFIFRQPHKFVLGQTARLSLAGAMLFVSVTAFAQTPAVGRKAPDFTLSSPNGATVQMSKQQHANMLVFVMLRGFPGYQCPYCQKQVHDFVEHAPDFAAKNATVLLVYPGPPADLDQHAKEFLAKQSDLPANIVLVTDPDYKVTNLYGLRWDAPHETAYPSTFIVDKKGVVLSKRSATAMAIDFPRKTRSITFRSASGLGHSTLTHLLSTCNLWRQSGSNLRASVCVESMRPRLQTKRTLLDSPPTPIRSIQC
jgi:peroxiredoxin